MNLFREILGIEHIRYIHLGDWIVTGEAVGVEPDEEKLFNERDICTQYRAGPSCDSG